MHQYMHMFNMLGTFSTVAIGAPQLQTESVAHISEYTVQHVDSINGWKPHKSINAPRGWTIEYGSYEQTKGIKITDGQTGAIWVKSLPLWLDYNNLQSIEKFGLNAINNEIMPSKSVVKNEIVHNLVRMNKNTATFTSSKIDFHSSWGVGNDGRGELKLSGALDSSKIYTAIAEEEKKQGSFILNHSIFVNNLLLSPSFSVDNPPIHELKFYPSVSINGTNLYKNTSGISSLLPSGSTSGEEWQHGFLQFAGIGLAAASVFVGGVGALGLVEAIVPGATALTTALEAGGFITFISGISGTASAFGAVGGGLLLKEKLSQKEVNKIKASKYNLRLNTAFDLNNKNNFEVKVPARGWAKSTSLFRDRTEVSFNDMTVFIMVDTKLDKVEYNDI